MANNKNESLKLENQLCFPLYVCSKEVIRRYTPHLEKLGLTYTQYITMMVIWEKKELTVKELGDYLYLDSGTLTPLLKKLEDKGFIQRTRSADDERSLIITVTESGKTLKRRAAGIPAKMSTCVDIDQKDSEQLYQLLYKLLDNLK